VTWGDGAVQEKGRRERGRKGGREGGREEGLTMERNL